jgi:hypothetical protein
MDIRSIIIQWQTEGVFAYLLPFLFIFCFVFAILQKTKVLGEKNKGLNAVISVALALLSLQFDQVPLFFQELFPSLGVSLAIMFSLMILVFLFVQSDEQKKGWNIIFSIIAAVVGIIIVLKALGNTSFGSSFSFGWDQWIGYLVGAVLLIGLIVAVVNSSSD